MIEVLGAVLIAGATVQTGPGEIAAAAARRCDIVGYQAVVDRIEDQAFAAMKAANEAVAKAARTGPVGDAGDADWAAYKALMAQAEQLRWANAAALEACHATTVVRRDLATGGSAGGEEAQTAQLGTSPEPRPQQLRLSVSEGAAELGSGWTTSIPIYAASGSYRVTSPTPNGPITYPGGTFSAGATPTGQSIRLAGEPWESQSALSLSYAQNGFHAPGWRFYGSVSVDYGSLDQHLGSPLSAAPNIDSTATPSVSCVVSSAFTGQCVDYSLSVPFTSKEFGVPPTITGLAATMMLNSDTIDEHYTQVGSEVGVSRTIGVSPLDGGLNVTPGVKFGARWWSFSESQLLGYEGQSAVCCNSVSYTSTGQGPGFSAAATLSVDGKVGPTWPLTWALTGDVGAEWVQLTDRNIQNLSILLDRTRLTAGFGGQLEYDFLPDWGAVLSAQERLEPYISSMLGGQTPTGVSINDGFGNYVDLRTAWSRHYSVTVHHDF